MLYRPEQVAEGQTSPRLECEEGRKRRREEEEAVARKKGTPGFEECDEVRTEFVLVFNKCEQCLTSFIAVVRLRLIGSNIIIFASVR